MSEFIDDDVVRLEVAVDDSHAMDGINSKNQVGDVYLSKALFQVNFLSEELPEAAATAIIEDKEVEVIDAKGVVKFDIEAACDTLIDLLFTFESSYSLLIQPLDLDHLHRKQILGVSLPHEIHLTVRSFPNRL